MVKEIIRIVLREALSEKQYNGDEAKNWTREIGDVIQTKLKGMYLQQELYVNHRW